MVTRSLHVANFFCCYHVINNVVVNVQVTGAGHGCTRELLRYFVSENYDAVCFHNATNRPNAYVILCKRIGAVTKFDGNRPYYFVDLHSPKVHSFINYPTA